MEEYVEYFGYAASALVLLSFLMRRILQLRIVNILGCSFFIVYGILIWSMPIIITNVAIVLVNSFFVVKLLRTEPE